MGTPFLHSRQRIKPNMANQKAKNTLIIDYDDKFIPVVSKTTGEIQSSASFSLAEQSIRSRERLRQLINFIQRNNQGSARPVRNGESVGVSHRLAAQVVYLAYWENYPLEFRIEGTTNIVVLARFTRQPELTFALDWFEDGLDPHSEIQGWWHSLCELISSHAGIWHIPLVVDERIYRKLMPGNYPLVQVDILPSIREEG
jgi:hypothetical protein